LRRDLLLALAVSALLHTWLAFGFRAAPTPHPPPPAPVLLEINAPPPLEPDEPLPADTGATADPAPAAAPPMQPDLPSVRLDSPFVQPIRPAPPSDLGRPSSLVTIPAVIGTGTGAGLGNIFTLSDLDQPPSTRLDVPPSYPYEMRRAGLSGEVELEFVIDVEGSARDVRVLHSTHREFEAPAIAAVLASKFTPGRKGGRAVNTSRVTRVIVFNLATAG
jgi:protein TonB